MGFRRYSDFIPDSVCCGWSIGIFIEKLSFLILNKNDLNNQSLYPIAEFYFSFIFTVTDLCKGKWLSGCLHCRDDGGNGTHCKPERDRNFYERHTWFFQIIMFLSLGLLVNPHEMLSIAIPATLIGIFMIVLARPLSVLLCLLPFKKMNINSRLFISGGIARSSTYHISPLIQ